MFNKKFITWMALSLCFSLIVSVFPFRNEPTAYAAPADNTIYTFNLANYMPANPDVNDADYYDFALFLSTLQGVVNKKGPALYVYNKYNNVLGQTTQSQVNNIDSYWFNQFRKRGQWLSEYTVVPLTTLADLMNVFKSQITGVVYWDPKVDATANVATTIAGVENAPAVMKGGTLETQLAPYGLAAKANLAGMFTGANAKTDAYVWAKQQYIDTDKVNPGVLGYVEDAYARQPGTFASNYTTSRDYLVMNKAFVIDLSPWADEKPNDAPTQTLGNDYNTMIAILQALKSKWGDARTISVYGFLPWWDKYATYKNNGMHGPVDGEWKLVQIFSQYNATLASILDTFDTSNSSFHTWAPVASKMNPSYREESPPVLGNKTYVTALLGDHDGSTTHYTFPSFWKDEYRGNTSLGWGVVPNMLEDMPDIAEYAVNTLTPKDSLTAGASGAGYSDPGIFATQGIWKNWNKYWYGTMGYTHTSFIHNGNGGFIGNAVEQNYAEFSNDGIAGLDNSINGPVPAVRNTKLGVTRLTFVDGNDLSGAANGQLYPATSALTNPGQQPNFIAIHTSFSSPTFHAALEKKAIAEHPEWNYEFVDPYTFNYLLHQKIEGNLSLNSIMLKTDVPDVMIAGETYPVEITQRNMGTATWTQASFDRLSSPSPNQFIWKNFADGGYSNNATDQRVFLSASDSVGPMKMKTYKFAVQAPTVPGNYTFAAQSIRDLVNTQGQLYTKTVQVIARPAIASQLVSISAPDTAVEGASIPVTVTYKNVGTQTWTAATDFKLGSLEKFNLGAPMGPANDFVWTNFASGGGVSGVGAQRVNLSAADAIATGQTKTFTFNLVAPNKRGTYSLSASMLKEGVTWTGDLAIKDIRVYPGNAAAKDAAPIDAAMPIHLAPGEVANVSVSVKNVGTTTWTAAGNIVLAATSANQLTWSGFRDGGSSSSATSQKALMNAKDAVGAEQSKTFVFKVQAPATVGDYTLSARMKTDGGAEFGDAMSWTIKVVPPANASQVYAKVPATMIAGEKAKVSIEVLNTGSAMWTAANLYRLASTANNQFTFSDFPFSGYSLSPTNQRVFLNPNWQVIKGDSYVFNFNITAPATPGTYKLSVSALQDAGVGYFGPAMEWNINVVSGGYEKLVNAGAGTNFTDSKGRLWLSDRAYNATDGWGYTGTSTAISTGSAISVTDDEDALTILNDANIYQTARQGANFGYRFDVPNGKYTVELSMAEFVKTADAQRKFSMTAEGKSYVQDYDPYVMLNGTLKGKDIVWREVSVSDGQLNLQFTSSIDQAQVNAIKIVRTE
ncbi:malectin domain-containing carbohydrate-binding protein [Cohnella sp. GCM10012308]|uniref:malectin domain-containing carbohydrate-binding protein n=1 Tax=Cohnella sp. GCM10012308 TaxID=3317329 RepID=UPI003619A98B